MIAGRSPSGDDHLMGEKVADPAGESVEVKINVRCPADIDRVEVCRNNRFIYTKRPEGREASRCAKVCNEEKWERGKREETC